jgi:tetratricopeptide (TPR) repeat protein
MLPNCNSTVFRFGTAKQVLTQSAIRRSSIISIAAAQAQYQAQSQPDIDFKGIPQAAVDLYRRASALRKRTDSFYEEANPEVLNCYDQAIKLAPSFTEAYVARGFAKASRDEFKPAIEDYNKAITLKPKPSLLGRIHAYRAFCYSGLMQDKLALADLEDAERLGITSVPNKRLKMATLLKLGYDQAAIDNITRWLAVDGAAFGLRHQRADLYVKTKQYDKALQDYGVLLKSQQGEADDVFSDRAKCFMQQGKYPQAVADLTSAIKIDSENAKYYDERAKAYRKLNDIKAALADEAIAKKLKPQ